MRLASPSLDAGGSLGGSGATAAGHFRGSPGYAARCGGETTADQTADGRATPCVSHRDGRRDTTGPGYDAGTIDGTPMLYESHLATQIMLWLVLVHISWCAVIATRKQRAPAMAETTVHALGDHLQPCNTDM